MFAFRNRKSNEMADQDDVRVESSEREANDLGQDTTVVERMDEPSEMASEMSKTLMVYIGQSIEQWSNKYHMQALPKKAIFKKALNIMNAWDKIGFFELW